MNTGICFLNSSMLLLVQLYISVLPIAANEDTISASKTFSIKTNLIQFGLTGEIRLITEKYLNKNNSMELITSYFTNHTLYGERNPNYFSYQRGFKAGVGYRYYLENGGRFLPLPEAWLNDKIQQRLKNKIYINPLFFYKQMAYTNMRVKGIWETGDHKYYYNYSSRIYALQFQMGIVLNFSSFMVDGYWGAGIRYRNATGVLVYECSDLKCYSNYRPEIISNWILPTLHLGLTIGFGK